jgi:two-component system heavy metal sensor histidine kinase CusS
MTLPTGLEGRPYRVAIALDITHHQVFMAEFHRLVALAIVLAVLATAGLGWVATRRGLHPLREMTRMASTLSANRLTERLQGQRIPAELQDLVQAFNAMLDRLEESFQRLSHFSSDIAHELRTPISNLRTQTEVALTRARSAEEYRDTLQSNLEEYEWLARMIGDMLFLAQADNKLIVPRREPIDLHDQARRLAEFYEALAAEHGVGIEVAGAAHSSGDRLMLQRALSNLLSNAIRHTPRGGTISLLASEDANTARIAVENPGSTIPPEHLPHLFDRFYQADPARRQGQGEHAGLGLAITKSIVEAHGGKIAVRSEAGRTRFEITLPKPA